MARAVAPDGVRVNMVSPGFVETAGAKKQMGEIERSTGLTEDATRQQIMDVISGIPLVRTGRAEKVAELVAFLA